MTFLGRIRNRNLQNGSDPAGSVSSTLVTNLPYLDTLSVNHQNVDPGQTPFFLKIKKNCSLVDPDASEYVRFCRIPIRQEVFCKIRDRNLDPGARYRYRPKVGPENCSEKSHRKENHKDSPTASRFFRKSVLRIFEVS